MPRIVPSTHSYVHEPEQTALPPCDPDCACCCLEVLTSDYSLPFVADVAKFVALPVASPQFEFAASQPFSVSFWVRYDDAVHVPATGCVIHRTGYDPLDATTTGWQIFVEATGEIKVDVQTSTYGSGANPNARVTRLSSTSYIDGNWHHIAVVYDGSFDDGSISIYGDGVLDNGAFAAGAVLTGTTVPSSNVRFEMGRAQDAAGNGILPLDLYIDEPTIWEKALSPDEVAFLRGSAALNGPCVPAIPELENDEHCPSGLLLWYRCGDHPTDKLVATPASPAPPNLFDASGLFQAGLPVGYDPADFFAVDAPPKCSCTSPLGGDNPETWATDPRDEQIVTFAAETGVNTATPGTWNTSVEVTDQQNFVALLSTNRLGATDPKMPYNAASPLEWPTENPGVVTPGSYRGWDATIDLASLQSSQDDSSVFAFDAKTTEVSWFRPYLNAWEPKADHAGNPCQQALYTDNPGLIAMPACLPGGQSNGVVVKTCGDTAALQAGFSFYDPDTDTWNVLNNAAATFEPGTCLASDPLCAFVPARNFVFVGQGNSNFIWLYDCAVGQWIGQPIAGPTGNHLLRPGSSMALDPWSGDLYVIWWHSEAGPTFFELWTLPYGTANWAQLASPPVLNGSCDLYDVPTQKLNVAVHKQASPSLPQFSLFVASRQGTHWLWYQPGTDSWSAFNVPTKAGQSRSPKRYKTGAAVAMLRRES